MAKTYDSRTCSVCSSVKNISEFPNGKKCKPCLNEHLKLRYKEIKRKCVEYKGGECEKCGYSRYIGALDFHHKNPDEKEFQISKASADFSKNIKELDKCMLLCVNCHREEHERIDQLKRI